jgi:hypothetical protein
LFHGLPFVEEGVFFHRTFTGTSGQVHDPKEGTEHPAKLDPVFPVIQGLSSIKF